MMRSILRLGADWLDVTPEQVEACIESDHMLDAVVSALTARAAELGNVRGIEDHEHARVEGWIVLPDGPLSALGGARVDGGEAWDDPPEKLIPDHGYLELYLPERFALEIQDRVGGPWMVWAGGLERDWFFRADDGSYLCTGHGGSPIYFRALSIDDRGVFEHVDGDGFGHVYRYRLRAEPVTGR